MKNKLCGWLGPEVKPVGKVCLQTEYTDHKIRLEYVVVNKEFTPLLGFDSCLDLDIIKFTHKVGMVKPADQPNDDIKQDPVTKNYLDRFEGLEELSKDVHLEMNQDIPPVVHTPRRLPVALMEPVKQKLEQMVADGVAVKEDGPSDWVNSMLVVDKKKKSLERRKKVKFLRKNHNQLTISGYMH